MPGPMTHYAFYSDIKEYLEKNGHAIPANYDKYSLYAQGHDLILYQIRYNLSDENRLSENIELSKKLQEYSFQEFICQYLTTAEQLGILEKESVRAFIEGYIGHHILDMYAHPMIIFYAGDHVRTKQSKKWNHGVAENLIDIYMAKKYLHLDITRFPIHTYFDFDPKIFDKDLIRLLNISLEQTYGYKHGSALFYEGCKNMHWFMKTVKYDPHGIKRRIFDMTEPFLHGVNSFSYHRTLKGVDAYINPAHELWNNPMKPSIVSTESFDDLYGKAIRHTEHIIVELDAMIATGHIEQKKIETMIPNLASTHGLECGQTLVINMTKKQQKERELLCKDDYPGYINIG